MAFTIPTPAVPPVIAYRKEDRSIGFLQGEDGFTPKRLIAAALKMLAGEKIIGKPLVVYQGGKK